MFPLLSEHIPFFIYNKYNENISYVLMLWQKRLYIKIWKNDIYLYTLLPDPPILYI